MKSLLWKEWTENLTWAVLALLLVGASLFLALRIRPTESIMDSRFLTITTLFSAVFGTVLGFLQIFSEADGDRRALLLHRPISALKIFLAKSCAGLALYLLALGIPFACAVGWVATPGHIPAPFRWPMVLPGLADILAGVVYYFAGMHLAQREARWYGSRALGLVTAVLCSLLVFCLPEFRHALVVVLVMGALLGTAAWGSFTAGGSYTSQPKIARAALAVTLLTALLVLSTSVQIVLGVLSESPPIYWYKIDRQGRGLSIKYEAGDMSVTDLAGHDLPELKNKPIDWHAIQEFQLPMAHLNSGFEIHWYRLYDRLFMPIPSQSARAERWYYLFDEARLLGYDRQSKRLIGSIGPDGFVPANELSVKRFKGKLLYRCGYFVAMLPAADFLPFSSGVYTVDFAERTIHYLVAPGPTQIIVAAQRTDDEKQASELTFVLTENGVRAVDATGGPVFSAPLAYDSAEYRMEAGRLDKVDHFVVWYEPLNRWESRTMQAGHMAVLLLEHYGLEHLPLIWDKTERKPSYLVEYDANGKEVKRQTIPPLPVAKPAPAQSLYGLATPLGGVILYAAAHQFYFPDEHGLTIGIKGGLPGFATLMLLSAAIAALVCFLLARRHAFSRARCLGWALCGFLWGPVGLLLMLALQEWPASIACPKCSRRRVVTRDRCEHCGALHAEPARDGTEIFEETAATPQTALAR